MHTIRFHKNVQQLVMHSALTGKPIKEIERLLICRFGKTYPTIEIESDVKHYLSEHITKHFNPLKNISMFKLPLEFLVKDLEVANPGEGF